MLVITKVEDPEGTGYTILKFAPSVHDTDNEDDDDESETVWILFCGVSPRVLMMFLDLFKKIHDTKIPDTVSDTAAAPADHTKSNKAAAHSVKPAISLTRSIPFDSLNLVMRDWHMY